MRGKSNSKHLIFNILYAVSSHLIIDVNIRTCCIALGFLDTGLSVMEVHRISMVYRFIGRLPAFTREGDEAPLPPFNPPSTPQKWGWV